MSAEVKIGLIGCGRRMPGVTANMVNPANGKIKVVSIYDPSEKSVQRVKEQFGNDVKEYSDYRELLKDKELDWVLIGSWNNFHAEQAIAAFEAGKNVFCEKPLATNVEDCLAIRKAWKKSGKQFVIGFVLRYSPHYKQIKNILDSGKIGDIISMEFNETLNYNHGGFIHSDWRRKIEFSGGHVLEKCCHDIDLVNWFVGSRAKKVASFGGRDFFKPENKHYMGKYARNEYGKQAYMTWYNDEDRPPFTPFDSENDIVDNQVAIVEFENNVRTTFHTNCNTALPERRMYICGTEGTLRSDVYRGLIEVVNIGFYNGVEDLSTTSKGGHGGGDTHLGKYMSRVILRSKGLEPEFDDSDVYFDSTLDDGLYSAFTAFGMDKSVSEGCVVDMGEYWNQIDG